MSVTDAESIRAKASQLANRLKTLLGHVEADDPDLQDMIDEHADEWASFADRLTAISAREFFAMAR